MHIRDLVVEAADDLNPHSYQTEHFRRERHSDALIRFGARAAGVLLQFGVLDARLSDDEREAMERDNGIAFEFEGKEPWEQEEGTARLEASVVSVTTIAHDSLQGWLGVTPGCYEDEMALRSACFVSQRTVLGATNYQNRTGKEKRSWSSIPPVYGASVDVVTELGIGVHGETYDTAFDKVENWPDVHNQFEDFQILERSNNNHSVFGHPEGRNLFFRNLFPGVVNLTEKSFAKAKERVSVKGIIAELEGMHATLDELEGVLATLG